MARRNWTICTACPRKMNKKKFEKTRLKVCYACHLKALKLQRRAIRNG